MTYIRTDKIKKKQSDSMRKKHSNTEYNWDEINKKRKQSYKTNGTKPGRNPGSGREKTGSWFPCPECDTPVYHQKKMIENGIRKYCSRDCLMKSDVYRNKLKSVDRSYTQTEEYKDKFRKETTPEYRKYRNIVGKLSEKNYVKHFNYINPNNYPRTLAGVDGGYQLDHIKPIKECFDEGIDPEIASSVDNLRMLPWKENIMRHWNKNDII